MALKDEVGFWIFSNDADTMLSFISSSYPQNFLGLFVSHVYLDLKEQKAHVD